MQRLGQRRVDSLKPKKATYEVRDAEMKGFGIRILPSGAKRYFVHHQHAGRRAWRTIGNADDMTEVQARSLAAPVIAAFGNGEEAPEHGDALFEDVAEEVFRRYGRNWKPRTLAVNRAYLRKQILPYFGGQRISEITREDVQSWFSSLHATPVAADRSAPILSVILHQAEVYGHPTVWRVLAARRRKCKETAWHGTDRTSENRRAKRRARRPVTRLNCGRWPMRSAARWTRPSTSTSSSA